MSAGRLQGWLQGDYGREPRCAWLGNLLSDLRYWLWRARGGVSPSGKEQP